MISIKEITRLTKHFAANSPERNTIKDVVDEVKELRALVKVLADACDKVHKQAAIIQPFLGIWKEHGSTIEKYRNRL